ncbi:phospholipase D family protein [Ethanoligenens sp.]|uniref:phospholipase D family nuclease n=1 Tax=Ethanoligenens sp. TaxID=2099655 RepID=UPI0039E88E40
MKKAIALLAAVALPVGLLAGCSNISNAPTFVSSTPVSFASAEGGDISVYFPRAGQDAEGQLISELGTAKKTLDVAIYSFTDAKIADSIAAAKKRGVTVRLISDRDSAGSSSQKKVLNIVKAAGIPVKVNSHSGIMHWKVSIIDDSVTTSGSFNYTKSAQSENDENLVILNNVSISQQYEAQFNRMWNDTTDFQNWNG